MVVPQTTENMIDVTDPADRPRNPAVTATTTVGHLYRHFSKKKKTKKKQEQEPQCQVQEQQQAVTAAVPTSDSSNHCDRLRVRPALAGDVVHAPPWLVADHFVSEHVAHEHVSVVPEPDHADPAVAPDEVAVATDPAVDALSDCETVECPPPVVLSRTQVSTQ